jgi:hypothetical protein
VKGTAVTAQPEYAASYPVAAIPHTINAIGEALTGAKRARVYGPVLAAAETEVAAVMRQWWKTAMLDAAPGADTSRSNATGGRSLISADELLARVEGAR